MKSTTAAAWAATTLAIVVLSCGRSGDVPEGADVVDIIAEAQGTKPVSKWRDSPAREAVRSSFRTLLYFDSVHEAEVRSRFQRPELRNYLMLEESYVGGTFPQRIATLLREVHEANRAYLLQVESFPTLLGERLARTDLAEQQRNALQTAMAQATAARQRPINEMIFAFDNYVTSAAQLYETVAASSGSVKSMRDGLYISNPGALGRFNKLVDEVNRAHEVADSALRRLAPEQQTRFRRMGLATPIRK